MLPLVPVDLAPKLPELKQRADRLSSGLSPSLKTWIEQQGREQAAYPHFDEARLRLAVVRRLQGQPQQHPLQTDGLVLLVLKAAADAAEQELRRGMQALRRSHEDKQAAVAVLAEFHESRSMLKPPRPERAHLRVVPPLSEQRLSELDETTEAAAQWLQVLNDRRSRVIAALFGTMKRLPMNCDAGLGGLR